MISVSLASAVAVGLLMLGVWIASLPLRDASVVDCFWGPGFVLVGWIGYTLGPTRPSGLLLAILVTLWGLRLGLHLLGRNWGKGEDFRYAEMRRRRPRWFPIWSLLWVFTLQGALMWTISLPLQRVGTGPDIPALLWLGLILGMAGTLFEAIADEQLRRFRRDPASQGEVLDRGLWSYSRHPNYFGDALAWWGFWVAACGGGAPLWTVASPILMTILLMRVSGVTLLEPALLSRRKGYAEYVARTSAFFPWPPRRTTDG